MTRIADSWKTTSRTGGKDDRLIREVLTEEMVWEEARQSGFGRRRQIASVASIGIMARKRRKVEICGIFVTAKGATRESCLDRLDVRYRGAVVRLQAGVRGRAL
jgi:hypothetical protein